MLTVAPENAETPILTHGPDMSTSSHLDDMLGRDAEMADGPSQGQTHDEDLNQTPITSLYQLTRLRSLRSQHLPTSTMRADVHAAMSKDLISNGILDLADADRLTRAYLETTDHYLYGIASKYKNLASIRRESSLLLAAICTVSALQNPAGKELYRVCHIELRKLISNWVFVPSPSLEDFRGLCIASFWLSDISWSVSRIAIRRAVEFGLHKSSRFAVESAASPSKAVSSISETLAEQARLWHLFYICDQHLSILYGRNPTVREEDSTRNWDTYFTLAGDSFSDKRIFSQVIFVRILSEVSETLGQNKESRIPVVFKSQIDNFNHQLDRWVALWLSRYKHLPHIGDYPRKAVMLHFYFAKLLVCSHVFQGLASDSVADPLPPEFQDLALTAVESAKSILDHTIHDPDLKLAFVSFPHYFHTMIALACSFPLKTATKYRKHVRIDVAVVFGKINLMLDLCRNSHCTQYHLIHWIGDGLQKMLSNTMNAAYENVNLHETGQIQATIQQYSPAGAPHTMYNTLPQPTEGEGAMDSTQDLGSIWDAARAAAIPYPTDRMASLYDFPDLIDHGSESMGGLQDAFGDRQQIGAAWGAYTMPLHAEYLGLGRL